MKTKFLLLVPGNLVQDGDEENIAMGRWEDRVGSGWRRVAVESVGEVMENDGVAIRRPLDRFITVETCRFIPVSSVVPAAWQSWFWQLVSEDAPFSWGGNNRTLVTASAFFDHCSARLDGAGKSQKRRREITKWLEFVSSLGETYIDLEN